MSATIDPAKLKVVELRQELSGRGLDTKGNKAALVKRLKDALEKELEQEIPDTSIADTSTEDNNTSQSQEEVEEDVKASQKEASLEPESPRKKKEDSKSEKMEVVEDKKDNVPKAQPALTSEDHEMELDGKEKVDLEEDSDVKAKDKEVTDAKPEENGEKGEEEDSQDEQPDKKSSRWGTSSENAEGEEIEKKDEGADKKEEKSAAESGNEQKGDKRKRGSPSPSRSQRRRSRSPIKEDEPVIDESKVQLNWYDSDLHLQVDKESFLSARPYHDGAFGYIWAGVRATHGADSGKVCFEVKITEELKWEDNIKVPERGRRDKDRRDFRRDRTDKDKRSDPDERKKDRSNKKSSHDKQAANGEKKGDADAENKEETEAKVEDSESKVEDSESKAEDSESKAEDSESKVEDSESKIEDSESKMEDSESKEEGGKEAESPESQSENTAEADKNVEKNVDKENKEEDKESKEKAENGSQPSTASEVKDGDENKMETEEVKAEEDKKEESKEESMEVDDKPKAESKDHEEIPLVPAHLIRIGWSTLNSSLQLGEAKFSYGYESSGKFVTDKQFSEYGKTFGVGDVIGAYVEFGDESVDLTYTVNGEKLPIAVSIPRSDLPEEGFSLFPHVLSRNYVFEINLGNREEPWFSDPEELAGCVYVDKIENKISGPMRPETRSACEIVMMCGLPASGKTHWVKEYVEKNAEKNYTVIGTAQLLEKMTVNGNPLRNNLRGRWSVLLDKLSKCVNKMVDIAALRRRNYIIDQTNIFPSAQRRKMRSFEGFKRRAVIVVCGEEEQAKRQGLQEAQDGKDVPDIAVLEMKANMSLPRVADWIDEVTYAELNEQDAKAEVQKYNTQGKDVGFGSSMHRRDYRDDRFKGWSNNRRNDYRGNYRDRSYNSYDRGNKYGGGWQNRSGGNWSRNDRRDNRAPSGGSREWRSRGGNGSRPQERGRDRDSGRHGNRDSYRSRSQASGRSQGGNWQGGGNWEGQGGWGSQGNWQAQSGSWGGQGGWGQTQGQGKWNYGQGYGQQGYGNYPNWNYYGQYQNWNAQGQAQQQLAAAANTAATSGGNAQAWAQYAQQYAQSNTGHQQMGQK